MVPVIGDVDDWRYIISDRKGAFVKISGRNGSHVFTPDRSEVSLFDRLSATTQPIVETWRTPSFYYFVEVNRWIGTSPAGETRH
jgi:hypothetical protein